MGPWWWTETSCVTTKSLMLSKACLPDLEADIGRPLHSFENRWSQIGLFINWDFLLPEVRRILAFARNRLGMNPGLENQVSCAKRRPMTRLSSGIQIVTSRPVPFPKWTLGPKNSSSAINFDRRTDLCPANQRVCPDSDKQASWPSFETRNIMQFQKQMSATSISKGSD